MSLEEGAAWKEAALQEGLDLVVEPVKRVSHGAGPEEAPVPLLEVVVGGPGPQPGQVGGHGPHVGVNGAERIIGGLCACLCQRIK